MNNFLEKTDSYAEKGGRAAKQFQFSCIRAGNAAVLRKDMSTKIFRNNLEQLFCGDLTSANYSLNFVWAQAWNIAVESGVLEKAADQLYNEICFRAKHAVTVKQLVDLHIELLVRYAEAVSEVKRRCVYSPEIERCHKYVATHLFEEINVRIIADTLGVSTSYISHKFKEETGQTIVSFIQMSKIEAAKLMLENIELSVNDVMSRLGYISQSHFSQVFKKNTGLTPGKYRLAIKRQSQAQKKDICSYCPEHG
ncbi:MAG: AraC family transcriptional regulator [Clostridia bacterium]|nr:AraC family transcriptional regulator [Clostridia bacterium]NCC44306.1 AraC family transcriptional regulator [Clostridia bacterium]